MNHDEIIHIASFDIGKKNFAFYIEEMNKTQLLELKKINIPLKERYNENGTPTELMKNILDTICLNGKTILHTNTDLTKNCNKDLYLDTETFYNLTDLLDTYSSFFDKCSVFQIELQMSFGKRRNPMAVKLAQHTYSYFAIRYGRFGKKIVEFPAYYKTQVLGCEKIAGKKYKNGKTKWVAIDQRSRKKWSVEKATSILEHRGEHSTIENIKSKTKKDDLADTLTQLQAFKYLYFVEGMQFNGIKNEEDLGDELGDDCEN